MIYEESRDLTANYYIHNWRLLAKFAVYFLEVLPQLLWIMNHPISEQSKNALKPQIQQFHTPAQISPT